MEDNHQIKKNTNLGIVITSGESVVSEIKKHPVGAMFIFIAGLLISFSVIGASILIFSFLKTNTEDSINKLAPLSIAVGLIVAFIVLAVSLVNVYLYNQNKLILTTEKIAQIQYTTIVDRKVVQLSIDRLQDVSVSQVGVFPRIFKYGTVIIDTAGEQEDCIFSYAPDPYELSRVIMEQHEKSVANKPVV